MSVGRKTIPTALKVLRGTDRVDRVRKHEPKPPPGIPDAPPHLCNEALAEWHRMGPKLYRLGLLTEIDRAAFTGYCQAWADLVEATEKCQTIGKVIKTGEKVIERRNPDGTTTIERSGGNFVDNPYYSIMKRSLELVHKFLTGFGMDPSSRTRIEAKPPGAIGSGSEKSTWSRFA